MLRKMKIIDSHVHFGLKEFQFSPNTLQYDLCNDYSSFLKLMSEANVDFCCGLPIPDMGYDSIKNNEYLLKARDLSNDKIIPIARIDDFLTENLFKGFKGVKYHAVYEKMTLDYLKWVYKTLEYYKRPLIIHALFAEKPKQIKQILKIAPKLTIVLAHMGRGHIYESDMVLDNVKQLKKFGNVYFETSTVGNCQTISDAIDIIGSKRIMFGSDYPFGKIYLKNGYNYKDEVTCLEQYFSDSVLADVFFNTANNVFLNQEPLPKVTIAKMKPNYVMTIKDMLDGMNDTDRKFISVKEKKSAIYNDLNKCNHCFAILFDNKVVGYMRESGRNNNVHVLEEIYISPNMRGKGISKSALDYFCSLYPNCLAKSFSDNTIMKNLLLSFGFKLISGSKILNWSRNETE